MKNFTRWWCVLFVVPALLLGGCIAPITAPAATEDASAGSELVRLKMSVSPFLSYSALYIALEEGFFEEEGIDIEPVLFTRPATALPVLASGEIDLMGSNVSGALLNTIVRDGGIRIVGSQNQEVADHCPSGGFFIRKDLLPQSDEEITHDFLKNLKYYVTTGAVSTHQMDRWLNNYGLSLEEITRIDLPSNTAALDPLQQGTLDISTLTEPWVTRARLMGIGDLIQDRKVLGYDSQTSVLVFGSRLLNEEPELGERFMVAYLRGVRQYQEGRTPRNMEIIGRNLELDDELLNEVCWPYVPADGVVLVDSIVEFGEWAAEHDFIDRPIAADEFWEPRFVEAAASILNEREAQR